VGVDVANEFPAATQPPPPFVSNLPQPTAFKNACVTCHDDDVIRQQRLTRSQWDREINKMTGWGAKVKPEERDAFLDYLFGNYGTGPVVVELPEPTSFRNGVIIR